MDYNYKFPAVRGIQAKREYYISMVPLSLLNKLFPENSDVVQPEFRAQRKINEKRIPIMKNYILMNRDTYVFSALSASINGSFKFEKDMGNDDLGTLEISMDSVFLINDGQHRKAAIEEALLEDESLKNETISIVFFNDQGLERSQQMFTDLNKHAVKTSNSLATLYDSRDEVAVITKTVIDAVPFLKRYTDKERDILGKNSSKLFTLISMYKANSKITKNEICDSDTERFLIDFWSNVANNIVEWNELDSRMLTKKEVRENYIVTLSVTLIGKLGRHFYENKELDISKYLIRLREIDWMRNNSDNWLGRVIRKNGKVMNNEEAIALTCSKIKSLIGIELNKEELLKEQKLKG